MMSTTEQRARQQAKDLSALMWHIGTFIIMNAFFWILDLAIGQSGLQWAYWITLFWGLGLAFHVLTYLIQGRQLEQRKAQQYLDTHHGD